MRDTVPPGNAGKEELLKGKVHPFEGKQVQEFQVVTLLQSSYLERSWLVVDFDLITSDNDQGVVNNASK